MIRRARYVLLLVCLLPNQLPAQDSSSAPTEAGEQDLWQAFYETTLAEETYLLLNERLGLLKQGLLNLELPGERARAEFAPEVIVLDVTGRTKSTPSASADLGIRSRTWQIEDRQSRHPRDALDLWRPLFERVAWFESVSLKITRGAFTDGDHTTYRGQVHFTARGIDQEQGLVHFKGDVVIDWRMVAAGAYNRDPAWRIERWQTVSVQDQRTDRPLLRENLARMLSDPAQLERARQSIHEAYVIDYIQHPDTFENPGPTAFSPAAHDRHPGIAVVDVDQDGWDDLYVMARWGRNQLLHNLGDGTFEEVAGQWGLDIENHTASAIFADFDNDGDPDALLGRTLQRSLYMENVNGRFIDRSTRVDRPLPMLVSAVSAVDYDRDGLLDIYLSTYAHTTGADADSALSQPDPEAEQEMWRRHHRVYNAWGPANVLLHNDGGGRFTAADSSGLEVYRHTYQSTWSDYDQDGDADVYVVNDYAANNLFQNQGDGRFTDITEQTGTADVGFGMGASWGDYDNDGWQDLYVSNMFSKAGRRITEMLPGMDSRFSKMAQGNTLFRNLVDQFEAVSGLDPPKLLVEKTGWSWGGQFTDIDSDGWLDLVVLNGYYTAPDAVALPVDM